MSPVEIYTKPWCWFCRRAKTLLDEREIPYDEIDVDAEPDREVEMIRRAGGRTTVPQVFIGGRHVGGSDELVALEARGELDELLQAAPAGTSQEEGS